MSGLLEDKNFTCTLQARCLGPRRQAICVSHTATPALGAGAVARYYLCVVAPLKRGGRPGMSRERRQWSLCPQERIRSLKVLSLIGYAACLTATSPVRNCAWLASCYRASIPVQTVACAMIEPDSTAACTPCRQHWCRHTMLCPRQTSTTPSSA